MMIIGPLIGVLASLFMSNQYIIAEGIKDPLLQLLITWIT